MIQSWKLLLEVHEPFFHFELIHGEGLMDRFAIEYKTNGGLENIEMTTGSILSAIQRLGNRTRYENFTLGRTPRLVCPGMMLHPANFLEYEDKFLNNVDEFYQKFRVPFDKVDPKMKESMKSVKVRVWFVNFVETISLPHFWFSFHENNSEKSDHEIGN